MLWIHIKSLAFILFQNTYFRKLAVNVLFIEKKKSPCLSTFHKQKRRNWWKCLFKHTFKAINMSTFMLCFIFPGNKCFFAPSGPPVIVGMSINIASIDSISEVNMVSYILLGPRSSFFISPPSTGHWYLYLYLGEGFIHNPAAQYVNGKLTQ